MSENSRGARRVDQSMAGVAHRILGDHVTPELRTRMRQLPMRLRGSGLAATYAFVLSKADARGNELEKAYHRLAERVAAHVADRGLLTGAGRRTDPQRFLAALADADVHDYARISVEVEALSVWLSRLAEALCAESDDASTEGGDSGGPA
ncbi:type III-B CRISPR module-associated protein Cmr5 [Nocardiopsis sp. LOL_012]|uniref:type III-B CRISPR module-associated protein Cmr5 n=1 Tax=Nocardiopsis sp. LOL_012 TaxID=3345409 RepID=UPI003A8B1125